MYEKSKCFLHISRAEGLSYALLEAVYAGLPVICSDISENRFAVQFPTVEMVESENTTDIAEKMKYIINEKKYSNDKMCIRDSSICGTIHMDWYRRSCEQ